MKSVFRLSVNNPVLVHMITIATIVLGSYMLINMPRELERDMSFNWVIIWVAYPGVSPEEIEKLITKPIEDEITDVNKIESITSTAAEGFTGISVKFDQNISRDEFDKLYQDLRTELDKVQNLPEAAEDPVMFKLESNTLTPVADVIIAGDLPEKERQELAEELQDEIAAVEDVLEVSVYGIRDRQIWVEINPDHLDRYSLTLQQVVSALAAKNMNVPAGELKIGQLEYLLRTVGEFDSIDQIQNVIVQQIPGGGKIRIRDVARVRDTYEEATVIPRLNGKPAITLSVAKRGEGSTIQIVDTVRTIAEKYRTNRLPEGAEIILVNDSSIQIRNSLGKLQTNALFGVLLVLFALYIFMGLRNAIFVAIGIPLTLLITFGLMGAANESINTMSLFGLVLVLGIIVDDAIIVMENVYRRMQEGESPIQAAINGGYEVAWPVITASLTTAAIFLPLALLPGIVGKFMKIIPIIVALTLAASLFECFFILPSHIADWGKVGRPKSQDRLMRHLLKPYTRFLSFTLRRRYWILGGILLCLLLSFLPIRFGLVEVDMFHGDEYPMIFVYVTMPVGTRLETTDDVMREFEAVTLAMAKSEIKAVIARTGIRLVDNERSESNSYVGMLHIEVAEAKDRERTLDEIITELRQRYSHITGPERIEFQTREEGPPTGTDVEVIVKGKYFDELEAITDQLKAELAKMPGVIDIKDNYALGQEEIKLHIDEDKANEYGLTLQQIAFTVRNAFEGAKATVFRDGDEEIDVVVRFSEAARTTLQDVEDLKLMGATGVPVPLRDVAQLSVAQGYSTIHRYKGERAITITANVDEEVASGVNVNQRLRARFDKISPRYPGYTLESGGEFAEFRQVFRDIPIFFAFGVMLVYFILGTQFRSFLQPLIILMTVPFAFIGAMVGLITSGNPLSVASTYGLVALAGIVVNDSIVLVEFINRQRTAGAGKWQAIINAGRTRLRPILLTSITTVSGLLPMALGVGGKSAIWMPMASTIVWGLSVATLLTLFVIPAFYAISDDIRQWRGVRVETQDIETRVMT